ncbi:MAG: hypothetical protein IIV91_03685 [Alistipes sp.]|nr:hypothetical protein [Alistipes sp.]
MRRYIYILFGLLCCFAVEGFCFASCQERDGERVERECGVLASEFACQIACAHRDNSSAERVVQVRVPVLNVSGVSVRQPLPRNVCGVESVRGAAAGVGYTLRAHLYRLSARAVDYYIYTLCVLRL